MHIEAEKFKIEMTYGELWTIACDTSSALKSSLKDHWVNHQETWESGEKERLLRIKQFFTQLGRPDMYDSIFGEAKLIFAEYNKKKIK